MCEYLVWVLQAAALGPGVAVAHAGHDALQAGLHDAQQGPQRRVSVPAGLHQLPALGVEAGQALRPRSCREAAAPHAGPLIQWQNKRKMSHPEITHVSHLHKLCESSLCLISVGWFLFKNLTRRTSKDAVPELGHSPSVLYMCIYAASCHALTQFDDITRGETRKVLFFTIGSYQEIEGMVTKVRRVFFYTYFTIIS